MPTPCPLPVAGEAHVQRGSEIRYYRCPSIACRARRSPAERIEREVLAEISEAVLPHSVIEVARWELRWRLAIPEAAVSRNQRTKLQARLKKLSMQHEWGYLSDEDYRVKYDAVRAELQDLPDDNRIRSFDAHRTQLLALADAIAAASPARLEELCRIVVGEVLVHDREIAAIDWTPPARPFFAKKQRACPQGVSSTRPLSEEDDPLAWYVA